MIGGGYSEDRGFSPQVAKIVDEEVARIIEEGKNRAKEALTTHIDALHATRNESLSIVEPGVVIRVTDAEATELISQGLAREV